MQPIIYLTIGLLIGYLFFRNKKFLDNKVLESKPESQGIKQPSVTSKNITNPSTYSRKLKAGGRDYFFDLRSTQRGDKYLHITESRIKGGAEIRGNIVVFQEHIQEFSKTLEEMREKI